MQMFSFSFIFLFSSRWLMNSITHIVVALSNPILVIHVIIVVLPKQSPVGSLSYGAGMPGGVYVSGSPYSTSVRDQPVSGSIPAYSMWGSDSSQLYRPGSGGKDPKDKKQVCSTLLITTATLVVLAVLGIAAVAAYLGGNKFYVTRLPCPVSL
jgi:hypothetical protein